MNCIHGVRIDKECIWCARGINANDYKIANEPNEKIHPALQCPDGLTDEQWREMNTTYPSQTIESLVQKPKVIIDWSKLPKAAEGVVIAHDEIACIWYEVTPTMQANGRWYVTGGECGKVSDSWTYSGSYKDSLTPRPELCSHCSGTGLVLGRLGGTVACTVCQPQPRKKGEQQDRQDEVDFVTDNAPSAGDSPDASTEEHLSGELDVEDRWVLRYQKLKSERDRLRTALFNVCNDADSLLARLDAMIAAKQLLDELK